MAQAPEAEPHGDFAGQSPYRARGDGVDAALLEVARVEQPVLLLREILAAPARADDDADLAQLVARHGMGIQPRVGGGFRHGRGGQRNGSRNVRAVLDLHVLLVVELLRNLARHLYRVAGGIEPADSPNPAYASPRGLPEA